MNACKLLLQFLANDYREFGNFYRSKNPVQGEKFLMCLPVRKYRDDYYRYMLERVDDSCLYSSRWNGLE